MASKFSLYIAVFLFFLSWCLPAVEGVIGIKVILASFASHFMIFPIFIVFPVWANVIFLLAWVHYYLQNNEKGRMYAFITFILMLFGVLISSSKMNIGALVWLASSIFLLTAYWLKALIEIYARIFLLILIVVMLLLTVQLYIYEKEKSQYQDLQGFDLKHYLFHPKVSNLKIPELTQVQQNNPYRIQMRARIDPQAVDLSFLLRELIELDFVETVHVPSSRNIKLNCELKPNQQYDVFYPRHYLQDGYEWIRYSNSGDVSVGHPSHAKGTIIYRAKSVDQKHTKLQLIRKSNGQVFYEQMLLVYSDSKQCNYLPKGYESELNSVFELDSRPNRKFGSFKPSATLNELALLNEQCSWNKVAHNIYEFEGKRINFLKTKTFSPQLLCSDKYLAVGSLTEYHAQDIENSLNIETFMRDTLEPVPCGLLSYHLSESQKQAFLNGKLKMKMIKVIESEEFYSQYDRCPVVELHLNDGDVKKDNNYLSKS